MANVDKEVIVNVPIEEVFSYVSKPSNLLEFWPSLLEIEDVQPLLTGGYSAQWVYKMAGMRFEGKAEYTQIIPNQWFIIETRGGIRSKIAWTFRSIDYNTTRVTLTIDYQVPIPILGKLAEPIITKWNDEEADLMMTHLQTKYGIPNY
ncbi:SRPBCC family protein [Chloroflexota bacterium]